ncbi:MAG: MerR family transcriptional regulator [Steroidobacteraceae bacterium]|nr:MerR family transcriptional regulator [Steroidobacteraceae bacterium]MDW8258544.1 MerR family transcriptional regulator [Gammaproteobacteria bacterium]
MASRIRGTASAAWTIGQLARAAKVSTSMLRFYEREGLLVPVSRTRSGYRLYPQSATETLLFIRRAQRLGFSLADIRFFLQARDRQDLPGATVAGIAEQRLLEIERRLTELLVLRHELEMFLEDLPAIVAPSGSSAAARVYRNLVDQICGHDARRPASSSLQRLMNRLGCSLAGIEKTRVFRALRGRHVHVWREDSRYFILIKDRSPDVSQALRRLVDTEAGCRAHVALDLTDSAQGWLLTAQGPNAFLLAQLFLAFEAAA